MNSIIVVSELSRNGLTYIHASYVNFLVVFIITDFNMRTNCYLFCYQTFHFHSVSNFLLSIGTQLTTNFGP